jgi:hypothetical protein
LAPEGLRVDALHNLGRAAVASAISGRSPLRIAMALGLTAALAVEPQPHALGLARLQLAGLSAALARREPRRLAARRQTSPIKPWRDTPRWLPRWRPLDPAPLADLGWRIRASWPRFPPGSSLGRCSPLRQCRAPSRTRRSSVSPPRPRRAHSRGDLGDTRRTTAFGSTRAPGRCRRGPRIVADETHGIGLPRRNASSTRGSQVEAGYTSRRGRRERRPEGPRSRARVARASRLRPGLAGIRTRARSAGASDPSAAPPGGRGASWATRGRP